MDYMFIGMIVILFVCLLVASLVGIKKYFEALKTLQDLIRDLENDKDEI